MVPAHLRAETAGSWRPVRHASHRPSVVPEMFGDTMLANGTVYPEATVEARRYRLRILNACQARFLNLQLYVDDGSPDGITLNRNDEAHTTRQAPTSSCSGRRAASCPTRCKSPRTSRSDPDHARRQPHLPPRLSAGTSSSTSARFRGKKIILYNDAPAPFPGGDPRNDYFPGAPGNPSTPTGLRAEHPPDHAVQGRPRDQQGHATAHHRGHRSDAGPRPFLVPPAWCSRSKRCADPAAGRAGAAT